jgi:hypothetical protein
LDAIWILDYTGMMAVCNFLIREDRNSIIQIHITHNTMN